MSYSVPAPVGLDRHGQDTSEMRRILQETERLIDLGPEDRERGIALLRADDASLAASVEALLARHDASEHWMLTEGPGLWDGAEPGRIGPFRITGRIGAGGMGIVYRAVRDDGLFDQVVAIKLMRASSSALEHQARFMLERQILARLDSPSICRILDGGVWEGRPWLSMEYVDGLAITQFAAANRLGLAARMDLFLKLCRAVQYAHRQLIVHADLKPSNVLVTATGDVKLLDFGIARLLGDRADPEGTKSTGFTRVYAAPERQGGAEPTVTGDVYSLGAILHELLTDRVGGTNDSGWEWPRVSDCTDGPLAPARLRGDIDALCARALAPRPSDRYPDVAALIADIEAWRGHRPLAARRLGRRARAGRFVRRHLRGLAFTAAGGLALIVFSTVSYVQFSQAERARAEADARFADARDTAHYLLFEIMPWLEHQPGTLQKRVEIATVAQRYLDRLSGARQASDAVRLEAAEGLRRLAEYQAFPGHPNLGQSQAAVENLRKADAIVRSLSATDANLLRARILIDRVWLASTLRSSLEEAQQLAAGIGPAVRAAGNRDPLLPVRADLALADLGGMRGDFDAQLRYAEAGLAKLPPTAGSEEVLLLRANVRAQKGDALYYQGRIGDALAEYERGLAEVGDALRKLPRSYALRRRHTLLAWATGSTLFEMHEHGRALTMLENALADAREALAFEPSDREAARNLRIVRQSRAQVLSAQGRHDDAMAELLETLRADQSLLDRMPDEPRLVRDVIYDRAVIGEVLDRQGRRAEACILDRATMAAFDALAKQRRLSGLDLVDNRAAVEARVAKNCR